MLKPHWRSAVAAKLLHRGSRLDSGGKNVGCPGCAGIVGADQRRDKIRWVPSRSVGLTQPFASERLPWRYSQPACGREASTCPQGTRKYARPRNHRRSTTRLGRGLPWSDGHDRSCDGAGSHPSVRLRRPDRRNDDISHVMAPYVLADVRRSRGARLKKANGTRRANIRCSAVSQAASQCTESQAWLPKSPSRQRPVRACTSVPTT